jgi:hypothetical protein
MRYRTYPSNFGRGVALAPPIPPPDATADRGRRNKKVAKAAATFIQRLLPLRRLTPVLLELELLTDPAADGMDVGVDILLRKRFQRFHRGTESDSDADGTLPILDRREDEEDRTNVGLARLFGENLS